MRFIKTYILLLLSLFGLSLFVAPVQAQEQVLRVSPVIINVSLSPGKEYKHEVSIENLSSSPLPLRAALSDFMTGGEEGGYVFEETKTNPLLSWITLNENEFILKPKEKKTIQMTIATPKSIPVGGYYGVLFFEPVVQGDQTNTTRVNAKVGVLMLANIGVQDPNAKNAEILTFSTDFLHTEGTVPFLLRVKNTSLNFFSAKPILTVSPVIPFGQSAKEFNLEEKTIFPANVRRWTEETTVQDLSPNIYKAAIAVSTGNGQVITNEQYFIVFPLPQAIAGLVALLVVTFLFVKRKRLTTAIKTLIRP